VNARGDSCSFLPPDIGFEIFWIELKMLLIIFTEKIKIIIWNSPTMRQ
jgi:hypothetical protein